MGPRFRALSLSLALAATACSGARPPAAGTGSGAGASATTPAPVGSAADPMDAPIPLDPAIKTGTLSNGLTYYILPHQKPEQRAYLWLAVNAGSVVEDDDQQGLAHFVEHMAFNGTKRFPKQSIVNYLEKVGVRFGADLNAHTGVDETVYELEIPTDDSKIVDTGLDILVDWASAISFEPEEIEKERGVVLEEWRLDRGAGTRIDDKQYPILFQGSQYANRLPIGKPEIIKGAPREVVTRFYRDWYRPDLMAVIAVGDFDAADLEARIKSRFDKLPAATNPRTRPAPPVPAHNGTLVSVETDPEMPQVTVEIVNKLPHESRSSVRDIRRLLAGRLYNSMLGARFDELRQQPDSPFLYADSYTGPLQRTVDRFIRIAVVKEGQLDRALASIFEETLRIERHGFGAAELDRARKDLLRDLETQVTEQPKRDGREIARELLRVYYDHEANPSPEVQLALAQKLLPTITLDELAHLAHAWSGADNRVITVSGPTSMKKPTAAQLLAVIDGVEKKQIAAWEDRFAGAPLMAAAAVPTPGSIVKRRTIDAIGVTEWTLSNGARVVLKPTEFQNDEVQLEAFSPGGTSLVPDADFDSARFVGDILDESGVGPFDAIQLGKALAGTRVSLTPWLGELEEGMSGSASPRDLETLFQLVHLEFTAPRRDEVAFKAWQAATTEETRNRRLSPELSFYEDLQTFLSQNHRRHRPVTPEIVAKANLDKVMSIYRDRFGDAGDFTFVLVGNVDVAAAEKLATTYLASLPSKGRKERWKDLGMKPPPGVKQAAFRGGTEPKSQVSLVFHGPAKWTRETENDMRMLGEVLTIRLREVLREEMSGVYGVRSFGTISRWPRQERRFVVAFGCAPENIDKLEKAVFDEIAAIQKHGIGDEYLAKIKQTRRRSREVELKENDFWATELADAYRFGDDPRLIPDTEPLIEQISSARVQAAAKNFLRNNQYAVGILRPTTAAASSSASAAPVAPAAPVR